MIDMTEFVIIQQNITKEKEKKKVLGGDLCFWNIRTAKWKIHF